MKNVFIVFTLLFIVIPLCFLVLSGGFERVNDPSLEQVVSDTSTPPLPPAQPANPHNNVYFGDLHIHTGLSSDAWLMGVRTMPEDAYVFAKGGTIEHGAGYQIKISRPLDFIAITDHAEYLGMMQHSFPDVPLTERPLKDILQNENKIAITADYLKTTLRVANRYFEPDIIDERLSSAAWQETINTADKHYVPGRFTTFIGYEWSSQPNGANLHRNVIYRGNGSQVPDAPFSSLNSENPQDLLLELQRQNEQGMHVLAIPHNGNLSNGQMYGKRNFYGEPMSESYAALRARYEPIHEVFQVKGSSETHPILSNLDEFANFEIFESNMTAFGATAPPTGSYAREALRMGMEMAADGGVNPYQFGVIGSSDGHNSSSPVEEDSFHGKLPIMDGAASLRMNQALLLPDNQNRAMSWGSGGLAAIWAPENTREALFDAMLRKETFATSGPRITLRFFAGWKFDKQILNDSNAIGTAYRDGVPMGATLPPSSDTAAKPTLYLVALKDPDGANLDRLQVIKLWIDSEGSSHEKVFNVAASDNRQVNDDQPIASVGNSVDVAAATYSNDIGTSTLQTVWHDAEFDPTLPTAYYARALEIPTPRWSTYDAKTLGIEPVEPVTIQERAISSAIWYQPSQ